jgi:S4 domain
MQPCKHSIVLYLLIACSHGFVLSPLGGQTQSKPVWTALQSTRMAATASACTEQSRRKPANAAVKQSVKQPAKQASVGAAEEITVLGEDHNAPIDWVLSRRMPQHSRRFYRKELVEGHVRIDGRVTKRYKQASTVQTRIAIEHTR